MGWGAWEVREAEEHPGWVSGKAASGSMAPREQHRPDAWVLGGAISPFCHKEPGRVWLAASPLGGGAHAMIITASAHPANFALWLANQKALLGGRQGHVLWELAGGRKVAPERAWQEPSSPPSEVLPVPGTCPLDSYLC